MLVKATSASKRLSVKIKELGRIANEGETFEVSPTRYRVLSSSNRFNAKFVTMVEGAHHPTTPLISIGDNPPISIPMPKDTPRSNSTPQHSNNSHNSTSHKSTPVSHQAKTPAAAKVLVEPEIILIEPGKAPVKVDKNLNPIAENEDAKLDTPNE